MNENKTENSRQGSASDLKRLVRLLKCSDFPSQDLTCEEQFGLHCGVEDTGCSTRYDGADYGYSEGVKACAEWLENILSEFEA